MDIQTINHLYNVRFKLAAVHYNENGMRDQAVTKGGQPQYKIVHLKFKKGGFTVRQVHLLLIIFHQNISIYSYIL